MYNIISVDPESDTVVSLITGIGIGGGADCLAGRNWIDKWMNWGAV